VQQLINEEIDEMLRWLEARKLNQRTVKDAYPEQNIEDVWSRMSSNTL